MKALLLSLVLLLPSISFAAFTTDLNALKADLDATYQDGFID
jgi:hypothetical protein